jgi:uncharacterized protein
MIKYLLLAAFVYFVFAWLQRSAAGARKSAQSAAQENMVTCAHCGVHLPQSESVSEGSRIFCSDAHRIAGPK